MKQRILATLALATLVTAALGFAGAASAAKQPELPDQAGTYAVPGHPNMKLRVHVYHAKSNGKPAPSAPTLVCNLPDADSAAVDAFAGWKLPAGTTTYRLNVGSAPSSITSSEFAALADKAFEAWRATDLSPAGVTIARGSNTSVSRSSYDGQDVITWGRTSGSALATTYTWYYTATGYVAEVDTVFNNKFSWEWADPSLHADCAYQNRYDAQDILTHELGHWMGLDDHYTASYSQNTMYGYGSPTEVKKNTLATGDVNGIGALY